MVCKTRERTPHHITAREAEAGGERGRHTDAPVPRLPPGMPPLPVHHGGAHPVDGRGALDEADRRQRRVVGRAPHRARCPPGTPGAPLVASWGLLEA